MKSVKMFGKSVPLLAIVVISILAVGVFAGVLNSYGIVNMSATVQQSVILDGGVNPINDELSGFAGGTYYFKHYLENQAPISADVNFATTYDPTLQTPPEVETTIYSLAPKTTLYLTNKNPTTWAQLDTMTATLNFDTVDTRFNYELTATGLETIEYALIYYADKPNRFVDWGGNNPGKTIFKFTGGADITVTGSVDLGMNLPSPEDANIAEYDYTGAPDNYDHAHGAKFWIVPASDLSALGFLPLSVWNPTTYLFETELAVYLDCDIEVEDSVAKMIVEAGVGYADEVPSPLTVDSGETVGLLFGYSFLINVDSTLYTITTSVVPVP